MKKFLICRKRSCSISGSSLGIRIAGGLSIALGFATAFYGMWFYRNKIRDADEALAATNPDKS